MKIDVAVFALRGFGNDLLEALHREERVNIKALYTRKEESDFPYYDCLSLEKLVRRLDLDIPVIEVPNESDWDCGSTDLAADLALVSSFHRIFKAKHLNQFKHSINIHPSLLPAYQGATPINWMIKNSEEIVGLTAHLMTESVDQGAIITQKKILNPGLNDGELRKALAFSSRVLVRDLIAHYPDYPEIESCESQSSQQKKRSEKDALIRLENLNSFEELTVHIKAFSHFPRAKLQVGERIFVLDYQNPRQTLEINFQNQLFELLGYWDEVV